MLFASQLRRFRGCAAEACFKALAVAKYRNVPPQRPTQYYVRHENTNREELRHDENILENIWNTQRAPRQKTSVDLTVVFLNKTIWLEFKHTAMHRRFCARNMRAYCDDSRTHTCGALKNSSPAFVRTCCDDVRTHSCDASANSSRALCAMSQ